MQTGPGASVAGEADIRGGRIGSVLGLVGADVTLRTQRVAVEQSRLHIPLLFGHDVIHGMRTIFPVPLALASSFDSAAVAREARVAATEATAMGLHWTFAPMVDIARDPRWGRIVEGAGEDPYLGSVMAAAQVQGFQNGNLVAPTSLLATAKHFAAYGGAEGGRDYNVVSTSERDLWNVYLPPFHAAVNAGVGTLMASFNEINGTPSHANDWLLTDVLRNRWRFHGFVVSDWTGVWELMQHGIAADSLTAAERALHAGVDMEMSSTLYRNTLAAAIRRGEFPEALVDTAVRRVLRVKVALGLFTNPYRGVSVDRERREVLSPDKRQAAREVAHESIVLLKNDSLGGTPALPLRRDVRSLAILGPLAADSNSTIGPWAAIGSGADAISVLTGLRRALPRTTIGYAQGVPVDTMRTDGIGAAERLASTSDAVVLVLGERSDMSGEASSRASIELPGMQLELAKRVVRAARAAAPPRPVIVVLMNGRPLAIPWLADSATAIVESWFLGVEHGNALADVLLGDATPSGKLPATFPRSTGQIPIYYDHKNTGRPPVATEHYTSKYLDESWLPLYPFGFGLSYTTFAYRNARLSRSTLSGTDSVTVSADVSNTGTRAGTEVVQLYLRDDAASVTRPVRELRGFRRVMLQPGEMRTVSFTLGPPDLAMYDRTMRRVVEPGTFTIWIGGSSATTLSTRFTVAGDVVVLEPAPPVFR
jgi:beta-glucosidase